MSAAPVQEKLVKSTISDKSPQITSQYNTTALVNEEKLKFKPQVDSEKMQRQRDLVTKQTYEAAKLENDLLQNEVERVCIV